MLYSQKQEECLKSDNFHYHLLQRLSNRLQCPGKLVSTGRSNGFPTILLTIIMASPLQNVVLSIVEVSMNKIAL